MANKLYKLARIVIVTVNNRPFRRGGKMYRILAIESTDSSGFRQISIAGRLSRRETYEVLKRQFQGRKAEENAVSNLIVF